ncbi:MAG: hypothetical protein F4Z08_07470 [Chloroflexi bacterium]|nr:hypothetical protein [Chloroflexota bacterium]MXZ62588.1 hypothetical protein [Chloroflexota bacterium]
MRTKSTFRLKGRVSPGIFSFERVFSVEGADGHTIYVIVPIEDIEERDGDPTAEVVVVGRSGDFSLVTVPGAPLETGQSVWVPERDLIPA